MSKAAVNKSGKKISKKMQGARAVWVAVGILALAFLVGVLAPAWYFAGRLVENNTAVRAIGELQQQPSRMQAALNSIQDRLRARGFVRDSIEQLKRATVQFEAETKKLSAGDDNVSIGGFGSDDDVQNTIVNGRILMRNRKVLTLDEKAVIAEGRSWIEMVRAAVK